MIKNAWTQCTPFGHCILIKTGGVETKHFANRIQGDEYARDDGCELKSIINTYIRTYLVIAACVFPTAVTMSTNRASYDVKGQR